MNATTSTEHGEHTLGSLIEVFEEKSFALLFILLLGVSALPLPTGGATHVFDVIAVLVAAQLVVGRDRIWIPKRWHRLPLGGSKQQRFTNGLLKFIRFLERFSRAPELSVRSPHQQQRLRPDRDRAHCRPSRHPSRGSTPSPRSASS